MALKVYEDMALYYNWLNAVQLNIFMITEKVQGDFLGLASIKYPPISKPEILPHNFPPNMWSG